MQSLSDLRQQQAVSLAYFDVFWLFGVLAFGLIVLVPLMNSPRWPKRGSTSERSRPNGVGEKAIQYLLGNPLFAMQMTQHDIRASLYAPLRVLIYGDEQGKTCVEYDKPSSLFGQFASAKVTDVAAMLDRKLEQLLAKAT